MIDITKLTEKDIGREVVYISAGGDKIEEGILKSWNDQYVFVVYPGKDLDKRSNYLTYTAASTKPEDLVFGILDPKEDFSEDLPF